MESSQERTHAKSEVGLVLLGFVRSVFSLNSIKGLFYSSLFLVLQGN